MEINMLARIWISLLFLFLTMAPCWAVDAISNVLDRYSRPTTNLFIGAEGWESVTANAQRLPQSVFVILDDSKSPKLRMLMRFLEGHSPILNNLIVLRWPLSPHQLKKLHSCEHFDTIFFLGGKSKPDLILESLGKSHILVLNENGKYRVIENPSPFYLGLRSLIHDQAPAREYCIECSFQKKELKKTFRELETENAVKTAWMPGVNLITFLMLNGVYPDRTQLAQSLPIETDHSDWMPNNMLVQGSRIGLIDYVNAHEAIGRNYYDPRKHQKIVDLIVKTQDQGQDAVRSYFGRLFADD